LTASEPPSNDQESTDAAYELAYQEAIRGLSDLRSLFDSIQTRTGTLLAAAAIATSFLGGQSLKDTGPTVWSWIAIACFGGVVLLAILALSRPKPVTAAIPSSLIQTYIEEGPPLPLPMIHRDLSLYMEATYLEDTEAVNRLRRLFEAAAILLLLEVVAWVVDLA
jgi:hypothetical protein